MMNTGFNPVENCPLSLTLDPSMIDFNPSIDWSGSESDIIENLDCRTLERLAVNKSTPLVVLERLAYHPSADVRTALLDNENVPVTALWLLARDSDADVRYQIAENHRCPATVIYFLTNDENPYVACRAQKTIARLQAS